MHSLRSIALPGLRLSLSLATALALACGAQDRDASDVESELRGAIEAEAAEPPPATLALRSQHKRGLWVLCEGSQRVLEDSERVRTLVEHATALAATDLFVQVYRGGRAWYDAQLADPAPYRELRALTQTDTLADLIAQAGVAGIRVHAWVNVLSLSTRLDARLIEELGRQAVHVDRNGRSLLDYPDLEIPEPDAGWYRMGTPGVYLDPAAPGVSERLVAIFVELVTRYPGLAGLHLDYIRHPDVLPIAPGSRFGVGLDFGYGPASRERFRRETGLRGPYADEAAPDPRRLTNANQWDAWRRDKVTELVREIRVRTGAKRPSLLLSAAVISHVDRAYLSLAQDWRGWLEEGLLDFAVPMAYTLDDRHFRYQVESFAQGPYADRIWPGLGTWLFARNPGRAIAQIEIARAAGAVGEALFSYDSIAASPLLFQALAKQVARVD